MRVRSLIAIVVALAMAVVPVAASAAASVPMKASLAASADCDHHKHGHKAPEQSPAPAEHHGLAVAACGFCCAALASLDAIVLPHDPGLGAAIDSPELAGPSLSWLTAPPLRPPRI